MTDHDSVPLAGSPAVLRKDDGWGLPIPWWVFLYLVTAIAWFGIGFADLAVGGGWAILDFGMSMAFIAMFLAYCLAYAGRL